MNKVFKSNTGMPEGDIVAMLTREDDVVDMYLSHVLLPDFEENVSLQELRHPAETPVQPHHSFAVRRSSPVAIADEDEDDDDLEDDDLDDDDLDIDEVDIDDAEEPDVDDDDLDDDLELDDEEDEEGDEVI
jgi:hypothetical protein